MDDSDIKRDLGPTAGDAGYTITKAGLASIPVIGGAAAEIFSAIITPPLSKRRDKWLVSIAEGLKKLEEEVSEFKIEGLSNNAQFITTITYATQAAIRNHQTAKLEALRNVVLNAALPSSLAEDMQLMFVHFVDELSPWHLKVLKFFEQPRKWGSREGISYPDTVIGKTIRQDLENTFPELSGNRDFYEQLVKDLHSRGLVSATTMGFADYSGSKMLAQYVIDSHITPLGQQFIIFITSPLRNSERNSQS